MKRKIGKFKNSIANLELHDRVLRENTLILAEPGSGKTHLANKIREFVIDNGIATLYLDFSDPAIDQIEERFKHGSEFHYMRFDESDEFDAAVDAAIAERKNIYMAVNPSYFASKRDIKSKLSRMMQKRELLDNYYYFMQDIANIEGFHAKFEDFIFYIFDLVNLKKIRPHVPRAAQRDFRKSAHQAPLFVPLHRALLERLLLQHDCPAEHETQYVSVSAPGR